ncbi:MAG: amidotransferase [Gammaproteobacteria bacterium RIFCSPLOWO2_02_FULL_61_13]|nr:MAG: amidotransferase [Gammaproteobacteria bacterium RIFCSPLOWO2_02_FULL_61_13]
MRAHYLQHVPFEGLGSIEPWLLASGYEVTNTGFHESTQLPAVADVDFLVVMGGPMSVNDEGAYFWLRKEKRFIRDCVAAGKPVLGVCLGAQLIASAMGAKVYRNKEKEIGGFPVQAETSVVDGASFRFPAVVEVFHWHGETFDLPAGAVHLARSRGCENQAFQLGKSVLGLQFHLETTPEAVQEMVSQCRSELLPSEYVQSESAILAAAPEKYAVINRLLGEVLSYLRASAGG